MTHGSNHDAPPRPANFVAPPTPSEIAAHGEPMCAAVGTFGHVPVDDPRYFGGHVSNGRRYDPCRHADDCPRPHARAVAVAQAWLDTHGGQPTAEQVIAFAEGYRSA